MTARTAAHRLGSGQPGRRPPDLLPPRGSAALPSGVRSTLADRLMSQDGLSAGAEVLVFGTLIFFIGFLLVINTWNVIDADMAVTAAAREAARTFVEADTAGAATSQAHQAAADALLSLGRDQPHTVSVEGGLARCERITATVVMEVDPVRMPGGFFDGVIRVRSSHTEVVDPYRSGLPGTAAC